MITNFETIKARADIIEVLGHFLPLKKEGVNFTCNCPFHAEKSASFKVSPQKQIYHCFGCNVGGDVFKFIQEFKKVGFNESVEIVAEILGLEVVKKGGNYNKEYLAVLNKANGIFLNTLLQEQKVMQYLFKRGLNKEDLSLYDIGYIPQRLHTHFSDSELEVLFELGIVYKSNTIYAPLHDRISFGLRNYTHKIVGFSARTHAYYNFKNSAKYINSKESRVFRKSEILYNLSLAKSHIAKAKEVYVCEGFLDVIALCKLGKQNAVATCGTAFNNTHLALINKICDGICINLCFDKDEAGFNATMRTLEILINQGFFNVKVGILKNDTKDIGEVLAKNEPLELELKDGFAYFCEKKIKMCVNVQEKDKFLNQIKSLINAQKEYYTKEKLIESASFSLGIPKSDFSQKSTPKITSLGSKNVALSLLKTATEDKRVLELCLEYLEPESFGSYKSDFLELQKGNITENLRGILFDDCVFVVAFEEVKYCIQALAKNYYAFKLKCAQNKKDLKTMVECHKKLATLV